MSNKTSNSFKGRFGEAIAGLRGRTYDGVELADKVLASLLGVSRQTVFNIANGYTEPDAAMVYAALANLPPTASQILLNHLNHVRPQAVPHGSAGKEMAEVLRANAKLQAEYADATEDGDDIDAREAARLTIAISELQTEAQELAACVA